MARRPSLVQVLEYVMTNLMQPPRRRPKGEMVMIKNTTVIGISTDTESVAIVKRRVEPGVTSMAMNRQHQSLELLKLCIWQLLGWVRPIQIFSKIAMATNIKLHMGLYTVTAYLGIGRPVMGVSLGWAGDTKSYKSRTAMRVFSTKTRETLM